MSASKEIIEAIDLALANKAHITDLLGTSFPNGPSAHGSCRDIKLDLDEEQSARLLRGLRTILVQE